VAQPLAAEVPGAAAEPAAPGHEVAAAAVVAPQDAEAAAEVPSGGAAAGEAVAESAAGAAFAALPVGAAGLPLAPALVSRQDPLPPWLAPARSAPTARVMALPPDAWPRKLSWQAALVSGLSCALGPKELRRKGVVNIWTD
jgi:hypothetical protein